MATTPQPTPNVKESLYYSDNPLKAYPSYTYAISLSMMSPKTYNAIGRLSEVNASTDGVEPPRTIIASAGRYGDSFKRDVNFTEDFFIDNLVVETIIGMNRNNRASNATTFSFTITEPYGITLLDRLVKTAEDITQASASHLTIPYLLQVDFYAWNEEGVSTPVPNATRKFPLRLTKIDISVSSEGAKYSVEAIAFNHQAMNVSNLSVPLNLSVTATTVGDFFAAQGGEATRDQFEARTIQNNEQREEIRRLNDLRTRYVGILSDLRKDQAATLKGMSDYEDVIRNLSTRAQTLSSNIVNGIEEVGSFSGALNAWHAYSATEEGFKTSDSYYFEIDSEIAAGTFARLKEIQSNSTPIAATNAASGGSLITGPSWNLQSFNINAGTSILDVIGMAVKYSTFITNQTEALERPGAVEHPLNWYKIVPVIRLGDYDISRNDFSKSITYQIKQFKKETSNHPAGAALTTTRVFKVYDYLYTGQNDDVLDFQIEFNTAYYVNLYSSRTVANTRGRTPDSTAPAKRELLPATDPLGAAVRIPINVTTAPAGASWELVLSDEWEKTMLTSSDADMVTATLKINGDPEFIKQDDIYQITPVSLGPPPSPTGPDDLVEKTANGAILTDRGDIFCLVNFKSPVDIKDDGTYNFDETNIAGLNREFNGTVFSGYYRVVRVENKFSDGKFEQELQLVRASNQTARLIKKVPTPQ